MKPFLYGVLAVVALVVAGQLFGWFGGEDTSVADGLREDLKIREQTIERMLGEQHVQDSIYADSVARQKEARLEAEETARADRARAATLAGQLRPALPDTLQPVLDSLLAAHASEVSNKDRIIAGLDGQVAFLETRVTSRDGVILELQGALEVSKAESVEWERLFRKKDISILGLKLEVTCGPQAGVGYGSKGPDVFVGAGCTVGR